MTLEEFKIQRKVLEKRYALREIEQQISDTPEKTKNPDKIIRLISQPDDTNDYQWELDVPEKHIKSILKSAANLIAEDLESKKRI